jgi:hypothetical protein
MHTKQPFVGFEAEGPDKNQTTLFIPKGGVERCGRPRLLAYIRSTKIQRVYFGAGNQCGVDAVDLELLDILERDAHILQLLVEIDTLQDLIELALKRTPFKKVQVILVINTPGKAGRVADILHHVKVQDTREVHWHSLNLPITTKTNDAIYKLDKEIEL